MNIYCHKSRELIYDAKALKFGRIKAKNVNAKHICLLANCLSVIHKIAEDVLDVKKVESIGL